VTTQRKPDPRQPDPRQPYVGPRPFEKADKDVFFGRDHETTELSSLIVAHPVVLLYAQSGAGKTSMLNAALIPVLEEEGLEVLPPARVSGAEAGGGETAAVTNIYAYNALTRWIEDDTDPAWLSRLSIAEFLANRKHMKDEDGMPVLRVVIFDQFEELFTSYPEFREHRKRFFDQVRIAIEGEPAPRQKASQSTEDDKRLKGDPLLRVLFVIREDYLAQMDSYASLLPEKLRTRFRLERLREEAALSAVTGPLKMTHSKKGFAPGVAEKLVKDLMKVRVETAAGKGEAVMGEFVEPVQLQVVCRRLLEALPEDVTVVTEEHLQDFGDVGHALSVFYEECLDKVVAKTGVKEGDLRAWFDRALITSAGTRGTVYRGAHETGDIRNDAVEALENLHIIRGEWRAGAKWYELTHDRLIEPIQESNRKWMAGRWETEQILKRLEAKTAEWVRLGRGAGGLLDEVELLEVDRWVDSLADEDRLSLTDLEALVSNSRAAIEEAKREKEAATELQLALAQAVAEEQKQRAEQQAKAAKYLRLFAIIPLLVGLLIVIAVAAFLWREDKSRLEKERASQMRAAQSAVLLDDQPDIALLLGIEAYDISKSFEAKSNLLSLLTYSSNISNVLNSRAGAINAVALSPDGLKLAAACNDKQIVVWDVGEDQEEGTRLEGHADAVTSIAFSPDGKSLASGSRDSTVMLWSEDADRWVGKKLESHGSGVNSVAFSPDGQTLASASDDTTIILWDVATQRPRLALARHSQHVTSIAFSPDGKMLASASKDPSVILWNAMTGQPIGEPMRYHESWINCVAFSPDNKMIASGGDDNRVILTNVSTRTSTGKPLVEQSAVTWVAFSPDGNRVASATRESGVTVYDSLTGEVISRLEHHRGVINSVGFSRDSRNLITGGEDQRIMVRDLLARNPLAVPLPDYAEERVVGVAFGANDRALALAGWRKGVILYERDGNQQTSLTDKTVYSVAFSPNGKMAAWGLKDGAVLQYLGGEERRIIEDGPRVTSIAFSPDNKRIAVGRFNGSIIIWDVDADQQKIELSEHKGPVTSVAFSRDGKFLASGGSDRMVCLWKVESGRILFDRQLSGHSLGVNSVAFSYDRKTLASGSSDHTVMLWDVATGIRRGQLTDHTRDVTSIAFNPEEGRMLATGSLDKSITLWDVNSDENVITLRRIGKLDVDGSVYSLAFSPDGKTLASSGSGSSTVLLWDVSFDSKSFIDRACATVRRGLTAEKKMLYFGKADYEGPCLNQSSSP